MVFLIEDEEDHAKVFEIGIAKSDAETKTLIFGSGGSLFKVLESPQNDQRPDLMLLDLNLPDTDGIAILERVRSVHPRECLPIVVFSSSSSQQDIASAYGAGASAYLVKPVSFEDTVKSLILVCNYWLKNNSVVR